MYKGNDNAPASGRPGIFSEDRQTEVDRQHILDGLEGQLARREAMPGRRKSLRALLLTGVVVLGLCGAAVMVLAREDDKQIVPAGTAPLPPAAQVQAPALAQVSVQVQVPVPVLADEADAPAPAVAAAEMPDTTAEQLAPAAPARPAPLAKPRPPRPVKTALAVKPAAARPAAPLDNDVALLAALVTHAKASAPRTDLAAKLRQCKRRASAGAARQCRRQLCKAASGAAECKAVMPR